MNLPKTADGATICYGDVVYYLWFYRERDIDHPEIRSLTIKADNISLRDGIWAITRPESRNALCPKDVYRDRRRLVTIGRSYWSQKIAEAKSKLKAFNELQANQE